MAPNGAGRLLATARSPIPVAIVLAALIVGGAGIIRSQEGPGSPPDSTSQGGLPADNPDGFGDFLEGSTGGEGEGSAANYLAAEQQLRDQLAKQAQLEQQGDNRALVLRGLGAVAQPWTWLGPRNHGGRTRAFAVSPTDPKIMLAGGITGGVWRSEDGGGSWRPLTDTFSNISIGVITIDPNDPQIVYAGTGEAYYRYRSQQRGNGIMKSIDGGASWAFLDATTKNSAFDWVGDVKVSPRDSKRVYAATGNGVWLSTDGGESWGSAPVLAAGNDDGCLQLAVRPDQTPDVVFASCGYEGGSDGVYRSIDGGQKWEKVLPADQTSVGVVALAIAPSKPSVVYASVSDTDEVAAGLYRSDAGGDPGSWVLRANPGAGSVDWLKNCRYPKSGGQGGYDNVVAVDPTNADRLWVGGVDLFRSDDGGATLKIASDWALPPGDGTPYTHADQHVIVFDPRYDGKANKTVYFGNDGGLFRTDDDRADLGTSACKSIQGIAYRSMNHGYGVIQFTGGSVSDNGDIVIGGTQDNGSYRLDLPGSEDWVTISGGDGGNSAIDPAGAWLMVSYYDISFSRLVGAARTGQSADCNADRVTEECADATEGICTGVGEQRTCDDSLFYPPLERDPHDAKVLWAGGTKLWRTSDIGTSWTARSDSLGYVSAIAIAPSDSNVVYAGTISGHIYHSTDALADAPHWTQVDGDFPHAYVGSIAIDPTDPTTVYAAFQTFEGKQLWRSAAGGAFEAIDATLPDAPVNALAINPRNNAMVYAGTDVGVFESLDGGTTWRVANENLATTIIHRLVFRTGTSELYAFTFGRGAYKVDVGDRSPPANDEISAAKEVVLAPDYRDLVDIRSGSSGRDDPELSCGSSLLPTQTRSVWYRLISTDGGHYSVSTEGSNFDTVVAILTPAGGTKLSEVACNDDSAKAQGPSALAFDATAGRTYYIEVTRSASSAANTLANTLQLVVTR
jgi:hypothetical protein